MPERVPFENERTEPAELARLAETLVGKGNIGLAYTYNEPLIGYDFVTDCARLARERGLLNVLVTNGCVNTEPFAALLSLIDAANIDLKSFNPLFYKQIRGDLDLVKANVAYAARHIHLEVTTLVVPGENDGEDEIEAIAAFLAGIDKNIPLHLSRFFPRHMMRDKPPTPAETMHKLRGAAEKHLQYVYLGNM
jgi:pyruvate formate lyase activating enzyme